MTGAMSEARGAVQSARALRSLFQELFTLSQRQMELLDSEDFHGLGDVMNRKEALLQMVPPAVAMCREHGWELDQPSTYPASGPAAGWMREAADMAIRFRAHEKYCLGEMIALRSRIGERMASLQGKRNAAAGYRVPLTRGNMVDAAR